MEEISDWELPGMDGMYIYYPSSVAQGVSRKRKMERMQKL